MNTVVKAAIKHWPAVAPLLAPPRSKAAYNRLVEALDEVLDAGGADESHPLASLADRLGELIASYEDTRMPLQEMEPREFLRELIRAKGLKQSDLAEIGTQSVISEVLAGKRNLNARQIAALSKRFNVPAEALLP